MDAQHTHVCVGGVLDFIWNYFIKWWMGWGIILLQAQTDCCASGKVLVWQFCFLCS